MFKKRKLKSFGVKVISFDSELEFFLDVRKYCNINNPYKLLC